MVGVVLGGRSGRGEEEEELDVGSPSHTHKHTYTCMHEEGGEKGNERKREERKRKLTSEEGGESDAGGGVTGEGDQSGTGNMHTHMHDQFPARRKGEERKEEK